MGLSLREPILESAVGPLIIFARRGNEKREVRDTVTLPNRQLLKRDQCEIYPTAVERTAFKRFIENGSDRSSLHAMFAGTAA